jgi:predicted nucleotidyltransferase
VLADNLSLDSYIQRLINSYPSLSEIWLFGSRADATYKPDSDWDLLVFADRHSVDKMKSDNSLRVRRIDLLVVFDEDRFEQPWTEEGHSVPARQSDRMAMAERNRQWIVLLVQQAALSPYGKSSLAQGKMIRSPRWCRCGSVLSAT